MNEPILASDYVPDRPGIGTRLLGTVICVSFDGDCIVLDFADGRRIKLAATGWEADGINVEVL